MNVFCCTGFPICRRARRGVSGQVEARREEHEADQGGSQPISFDDDSQSHYQQRFYSDF
jgi:hypothetical protein